jgi:glyoxylase-like metal-dependent hydrolase (beta-lactamase superfamily II)
MAFVTGRHMQYPFFSRSYEVEEVVELVRRNFQAGVEFHSGDTELAPGISLHKAAGHTAGLQVVRVHTRRGWVVLASDATHYYENIRTNRPFTIAHHLGEMLDSYRLIERLAASAHHIIPGHDPLVMKEYPAPERNLEGIVVRLDVAPKESETDEGDTH